MAGKVKPIPDGYSRVTPYLCVNGAAAAIDFYIKNLGATERMRMGGPDGRIGHAELAFGNAVLMLADENPQMNFRSPRTIGGSPVVICLYVEDVDAVVARAVAAGVKILKPVADQFYGDRSGSLKDPFGHSWHLSTHKEDVSPAELNRRMAALAKK